MTALLSLPNEPSTRSPPRRCARRGASESRAARRWLRRVEGPIPRKPGNHVPVIDDVCEHAAVAAAGEHAQRHVRRLPERARRGPHVIAGGGVLTEVTPSTQARISRAQADLQEALPNAIQTPTAAQSARMLALLLQFAECMRAHGLPNFPDPTSNGIRIAQNSGIDPQSPQYQAAQQACARYSP